MNKMKKTLAVTVLSLASIFPALTDDFSGYLDFSYVPQRTDDQIVINQVRTEFSLSYNIDDLFNSTTDLKLTGSTTNYASIPDANDFPFFDPTRQKFDYRLDWILDNSLSFYFLRSCTHPIGDTEQWIYSQDRDKQYYINHDSETRFGLRVNW